MALGLTTLLGVRSGTDANQYTTASVTIVQDRIYILAVNTVSTGGAVVAPTVTGASQTWTLNTDNVYDDAGAQRRGVHIFRCKGGAGGGSGALTIDYAGVTQQGVGYILVEITDADLSGTNGAGAIRQAVSAGDTTATTSRTVTLAAFGSANNAALGFFDKQSVAEVFTEGSGFTELADVGAANPSSQFMAEWKLNETSVSASWTTSVVNGAVALEIVQATAGDLTVTADPGTATGAGGTATSLVAVPATAGGASGMGGTATPVETIPATAGVAAGAGGTATPVAVVPATAGGAAGAGNTASVNLVITCTAGVATATGGMVTLVGVSDEEIITATPGTAAGQGGVATMVVVIPCAAGTAFARGTIASANPWGPADVEETGVFVDQSNPFARSYTTARLQHAPRVFRSRR